MTRTRAYRSAALTLVVLAVPLVIVALVTQAVAGPGEERVVVNGFITLVLALAVQSFSGNAGILSFGHIALMGVGAYLCAFVTIPAPIKATLAPSLPPVLATAHLSFVPALLLAAVGTAIVTLVLALALARMEEHAMAMATLSLLLIATVVFSNWGGMTGGGTGLYGVPRSTTLWSAVGVSIVIMAICLGFRTSGAGLQLRASRTDPVAAEALGADVVRLRLVAWTLSGLLVGLGGALWALYQIAFAPTSFSINLTFTVLAAVVLGGLGSVSGVVVGTVITTIAFELLRRLEERIGVSGLTQMVVGALLLVVLYVRPDGLVGLRELGELPRRLILGRAGARE